MRGTLSIILAASGLVTACDRPRDAAPDAAPKPAAKARVAGVAPGVDPCVAQLNLEPIKAALFARAKSIAPENAALLDKLAAAAVVRMDKPVARSRDDALAVTVCRGTLVVDLPPGSADAFSGEPQLSAPIDYAVQQTRDGQTQLHQISAADPIVYRLAALGLAGRSAQANALAQPPAAPAAEAPAAARPAARPQAVATAAPQPPRVVVRNAGAPRRRAVARPSFDCRTAQTPAEQLVCSDPYLANLDRRLVYQYANAFARGGPEERERLERTRGRFLRRLDGCDRWACVEDTYHDRIRQIERIID